MAGNDAQKAITGSESNPSAVPDQKARIAKAKTTEKLAQPRFEDSFRMACLHNLMFDWSAFICMKHSPSAHLVCDNSSSTLAKISGTCRGSPYGIPT